MLTTEDFELKHQGLSSSQSTVTAPEETPPEGNKNVEEWKRLLCFCCYLRKASPCFRFLYAIGWIVILGCTVVLLYFVWEPFVRVRNETVRTPLTILEKNVSETNCCDLTGCWCGGCDSNLPECFWLVGNLRAGPCCVANECDLKSNGRRRSPTQLCQSACGTCWNISRIILLNLTNVTHTEFFQCGRDDAGCYNLYTTNRVVYLQKSKLDQYSNSGPYLNPIGVLIWISIAVPIACVLFLNLFSAVWVFGFGPTDRGSGWD
jgi:hypothetical protein